MTGKQLKAFRLRLGLTQAQVAHQLGVRMQTISHWEQMAKIPQHRVAAIEALDPKEE